TLPANPPCRARPVRLHTRPKINPHYTFRESFKYAMFNTYRIFKKELGTYFNSPQAYIFLVVFLVVGPALFFNLGNQFFKQQAAVLTGFFTFVPWLFLFLCPAIAMRIWSEEKRSGTEEI